jgi:transmembrane sensor
MSRAPRPLSQAAIDALASDWVIRAEAGLSAGEAAALENWRASDPRHGAALDQHAQAWTLLGNVRRSGHADEMRDALRARARQRRRRRLAGAAVAAAALVLAGLGWRLHESEVTETTPVAQILFPQKQTLPDGGTVELKPGAEIAVDYSGEFRRVTLLRGEALFHVAENKARPFVVTAGGVDVRAVGTAFLVAMGPRDVDVVVTHGRVAVERAAAAEPAIHGPTEAPSAAPVSTLVDAGSRLTVEMEPQQAAPAVVAVSSHEMQERLAWCGPRVEFNDTTLADAVALMNRHAKLKLVVGDPGLAKLRVNGLFRVDNTETLVRLLEASFGVQTERTGDSIILRRAR